MKIEEVIAELQKNQENVTRKMKKPGSGRQMEYLRGMDRAYADALRLLNKVEKKEQPAPSPSATT